jgi:hypothetical protein
VYQTQPYNCAIVVEANTIRGDMYSSFEFSISVAAAAAYFTYSLTTDMLERQLSNF